MYIMNKDGLRSGKMQMLMLKNLYWDNHWCTIEVTLSRIHARTGKTLPFTIENPNPHVSLSKHVEEEQKN